MMLTFYSNYLNHHQVFVADELHLLLGSDYRFVATLPRNAEALKGGGDYSSRPYCLLAGENEEARNKAMRLAIESDVCIFAADSQPYAVARAKCCPEKLSFEMGERWLKHGLLTIGSPVFRRWYMNYLKHFRHANFHKLCCSAFTARDDDKLLAYRKKHYKWGYFTQVDEKFHVEAPPGVSTPKTSHTLMWCARFLAWKHPEIPVQMAAKLKEKGNDFVLDMYGSGIELEHSKKLVQKLGVGDVVNFKGNLPNAEILKAMREHEIFLFTSDKNEGWGAVANESMANGCVLVASDAIGSTSYLIKNGVNGLVFKSQDIDDVSEKVEWLFNHPEEMKRMQFSAHKSMKDLWCPRNAAASLLRLIENLKNGRETSLKEGPCSKA